MPRVRVPDAALRSVLDLQCPVGRVSGGPPVRDMCAEGTQSGNTTQYTGAQIARLWLCHRMGREGLEPSSDGL